MGRGGVRAAVVVRITSPLERAFGRYVQHVWRCQTCTGGLCLLAAGQTAPPRLCRIGRAQLARVTRLWNPSAPITVHRWGRARLFSL